MINKRPESDWTYIIDLVKGSLSGKTYISRTDLYKLISTYGRGKFDRYLNGGEKNKVRDMMITAGIIKDQTGIELGQWQKPGETYYSVISQEEVKPTEGSSNDLSFEFNVWSDKEDLGIRNKRTIGCFKGKYLIHIKPEQDEVGKYFKEILPNVLIPRDLNPKLRDPQDKFKESLGKK